MAMVRVWYLVDGRVAITRCLDSKRYDEIMTKTGVELANSNSEWIEYDDIDESELPQTRKYRGAWTGSKGNGISIDSVKKAEIDKDKAKPSKEDQIEALEARVKVLEGN